MGVRSRWVKVVAGQLGRPSGPLGRVVGVILNRRNRTTLTAAVQALDLSPGATVADVGFGGGLGLGLLLREVGSTGVVHGIELSKTMLSQATRRHCTQITAGRLRLHEASMTHLPLEDSALDGILTVNTIYFVSDLDAAFAEFARSLKGTGRVIIGFGDPAALADIPFTAHGFRLRPVPEVVDALSSAGLSLESDVRVGDGDSAMHLLVARLSRSSGQRAAALGTTQADGST
ncbi:MAG: methyltransferase domain-containing protein [Actinomycetota bacterium]|nr:methyltransferase domain-containing protein [Actinomycetota bacterium]